MKHLQSILTRLQRELFKEGQVLKDFQTLIRKFAFKRILNLLFSSLFLNCFTSCHLNGDEILSSRLTRNQVSDSIINHFFSL